MRRKELIFLGMVNAPMLAQKRHANIHPGFCMNLCDTYLPQIPAPQPASQKHSLVGQAKKTEVRNCSRFNLFHHHSCSTDRCPYAWHPRVLMAIGEEKAHTGAVREGLSRSRCACVHAGCEKEDRRTSCGLLQALVSVKEKLTDTEGPDMKEQMRDQIRQWFIEVRYIHGHSPSCSLFSLTLFFSLPLSLSLSVCLSVSGSVSLSVSPSLSVSLPLSLSLSLSLCFCLSLPLCLFLSLCFFVSLSFSLSFSLCLTLSLSLSLCLSLFLMPFLFLVCLFCFIYSPSLYACSLKGCHWQVSRLP